VLAFLAYSSISSGDIERLQKQVGYVRPKGNRIISFVKATLKYALEGPGIFTRKVIETLVDLREREEQAGQNTIAFLLDLLIVAAKASNVKPILIFREVQLLRKWSMPTGSTYSFFYVFI